MDLGTLRTALRNRVGVSDYDGFFTDARLTDLINEAIQVVSSEEDWPWLQTTETIATVNGTQAYAPAADWLRTKALIIDGYDAMQWRSLQEIREYGSDYLGLPVVYTVYGDQILFGPTPGAAYSVTHDYIKQEPELAVSDDEPIMPSQFHGAILAQAAHLASLRAGDMSRVQAFGSEYSTWLNRMRDHRRRSSSPLRVRVRPGSGI